MIVTSYVCCFAIDRDDLRVLLCKKRNPEWQRDLWNGIGGKIRAGEQPIDAIVREFWEETGLKIGPKQFDFFHVEEGIDKTNSGLAYRVYFFRAELDCRGAIKECTDQDEDLDWWDKAHAEITLDVVGNCRWLIPMAFDPRKFSGRTQTSDDITLIRTW